MTVKEMFEKIKIIGGGELIVDKETARFKELMREANEIKKRIKVTRRPYHDRSDIMEFIYDEKLNFYDMSRLKNVFVREGLWPLKENGEPMGIKKMMKQDDPEIKALGRGLNSISALASRLNRSVPTPAPPAFKYKDRDKPKPSLVVNHYVPVFKLPGFVWFYALVFVAITLCITLAF